MLTDLELPWGDEELPEEILLKDILDIPEEEIRKIEEEADRFYRSLEP